MGWSSAFRRRDRRGASVEVGSSGSLVVVVVLAGARQTGTGRSSSLAVAAVDTTFDFRLDERIDFSGLGAGSVSCWALGIRADRAGLAGVVSFVLLDSGFERFGRRFETSVGAVSAAGGSAGGVLAFDRLRARTGSGSVTVTGSGFALARDLVLALTCGGSGAASGAFARVLRDVVFLRVDSAAGSAATVSVAFLRRMVIGRIGSSGMLRSNGSASRSSQTEL